MVRTKGNQSNAINKFIIENHLIIDRFLSELIYILNEQVSNEILQIKVFSILFYLCLFEKVKNCLVGSHSELLIKLDSYCKTKSTSIKVINSAIILSVTSDEKSELLLNYPYVLDTICSFLSLVTNDDYNNSKLDNDININKIILAILKLSQHICNRKILIDNTSLINNLTNIIETFIKYTHKFGIL